MGATQRFSIVVTNLKDIQEVKRVLEIVNNHIELNLPDKIDENFDRDDLCGDYPLVCIGKGTKAYSVEIAHENYYSYGLCDDLLVVKEELLKEFEHVWIGHLDTEELNEV
jgi:hypothetical protein